MKTGRKSRRTCGRNAESRLRNHHYGFVWRNRKGYCVPMALALSGPGRRKLDKASAPYRFMNL
ncbi:hypothetical protein KCP75_18455 [Salmonella enterica subsp. enterica]|nr:hypothetical protein KCP75_18455 [Salmonella enterica subsp. enterica]